MAAFDVFARWATVIILAGVGVLLMACSPFMLLLGGWGGADSGSILEGVAIVAVLPWVLYLASSAGALFLLSHRHRRSALVLALCQLVPVIWIGQKFFR